MPDTYPQDFAEENSEDGYRGALEGGANNAHQHIGPLGGIELQDLANGHLEGRLLLLVHILLTLLLRQVDGRAGRQDASINS